MSAASRLKALLLLGFIALLAGCLSSSGSGRSSNDTPPPAAAETTPNLVFLSAAGIGVSDLEASVSLYTNGMGMRELQRLTRDNRTEVVLESADARGSNIVLMDFTDGIGRNFQQNPGKLVFYAKDPAAFAEEFVASGGRITLPPAPQPSFDNVVVGFGRDLDNNLIEIVGETNATESFFGAFGLGVSDLDTARDFYVNVLGFEQSQFLQIPGQYDEYILTSPVPGSSAVVLMNWTNGSVRNYTDNPLKLELAVAYPDKLADVIGASDGDVIREPSAAEEADLDGALLGYASDADGTLLEIRQGIRGYLGAAGIGVEDLEAAVRFYDAGLGMQEVARRSRDDRDEVVMRSADGRGSEVVLMGFTDGVARNYQQNPGKLVFYVKDPDQYALDIVAAGGRVTVPPAFQAGLGVTVGFGRDLDNNLIEFVGSADAIESYFGAFGIGVSDLQAARDFYVAELGFRELIFLPIPFQYDEYILQGQGGSALVLMNWTNGSSRNYTDNPVKLEVRSMSPEGFAQAVIDAGERVTEAPGATTDTDREGETVGYAKDADGTLIEILRAPWQKN
ncbi:VOC family protein [Halopseudomonas pelagia]|uniref:VOC family protein n=1 Tax=Halopseudomonas pelagia TaxID=553151 RepID=UPI0030DB725E|tara:strand:+ start:2225 stop:3916 length:1692 start_codon:yes stop_codon:yes gene_type:complete